MKTTALVIACFAPVLTASGAELRFSGTAAPLKGDRAIYEEHHLVEGECSDGLFRPNAQTVTYVRGDGDDQFAQKKLSYGDSLLRPNVNFRQPDFNEVMEITNRDGKELRIQWQTPGDDTETYTVEVTDSLVADAGFDHLVRQHWSAVTTGESVEFEFLAPTRGKAYEFELEPARDDRINAAFTFRIKPSGTILGFLVDPILLGYNADGMLTDYLGLTNIRKDRDANYTAHIRYTLETAPDCELTR
ncbi:hypothetical protein QPM17_00395 [Marinobacter sp. TBZ242]|uniref:Uncharacterized protein n=1 Tax=Marinobacter azerbaijanicus TaxID=3050455 RepID=A0ABT7I7E3_9GAMM|nr:hypothetical protein [Marinobacter sp. TBZ242]MDL0429570.1 hypothetical protein [Marinobacter sp. TBZ242]